MPEGLPENGLCPRCILSGSTVELDSGGGKDTVPTADAYAESLTPAANFGPYRIVSEMGRGGMGVVYRAVEVALQREVALKVLLAGERATTEQAARFLREARSAGSLSHPNIVPVYSAGMERNVPYFAMEFVEGVSLESAPKAMDASAAVRIIRETALALHYSHGKGIVHRDVKPANILIDRDGRPRITDFGLAKVMGDERKLTQEGTALGTPAYMSPEQAAGRVDSVGPQTDIYSLGAVLYEILSGRPPFTAETPLQLMAVIQSEEPQPLLKFRPDLPRDLQTVCFKALEKRPERRYATMADFAEDLRRVAEGMPVLARPPSAIRKLSNFAARKRSQIAIFALVAMLAGAGAVIAVMAAASKSGIGAPVAPVLEFNAPAPRGDSRTASLKMDIGRELLARADKSYLLENPKNRRKLLEDALTAFCAAIEADPWLAEAFVEKGLTLMHLENFEVAMRSFDRAVELNPDLTDAYWGRVQIRYKQYFQARMIGGADKSRSLRAKIEDDLAAIERIGAKPEKYWCGRSVLLHLDGKKEEALQAAEMAINANDSFADAYNSRGVILLSGSINKADRSNQELLKALDDFTIATRLSGGSSEHRANRAQALLALRRPQEALAEADAIVDMLPDRPFPYILRSQIRKSLGDEAGYDRDMDAADSLPLDNPDIHIAVAGMLMGRAFQAGGMKDLRLKDVERVLIHLDKFMERFPDRRDVLGIRGVALMLLGRRTKAISDLRQYLSEFPDSQLAPAFRTAMMMLQGGARFDVGSGQETMEAAARHMDAGRDDEAAFYLERSIEHFQSSFRKEPGNMRDRRLLCRAHLDMAQILARQASASSIMEERETRMTSALGHAAAAVTAGGPGARRLLDDEAFTALRSDPRFEAIGAALKERSDGRERQDDREGRKHGDGAGRER